jgi:hypothetical protein
VSPESPPPPAGNNVDILSAIAVVREHYHRAKLAGLDKIRALVATGEAVIALKAKLVDERWTQIAGRDDPDASMLPFSYWCAFRYETIARAWPKLSLHMHNLPADEQSLMMLTRWSEAELAWAAEKGLLRADMSRREALPARVRRQRLLAKAETEAPHQYPALPPDDAADLAAGEVPPALPVEGAGGDGGNSPPGPLAIVGQFLDGVAQLGEDYAEARRRAVDPKAEEFIDYMELAGGFFSPLSRADVERLRARGDYEMPAPAGQPKAETPARSNVHVGRAQQSASTAAPAGRGLSLPAVTKKPARPPADPVADALDALATVRWHMEGFVENYSPDASDDRDLARACKDRIVKAVVKILRVTLDELKVATEPPKPPAKGGKGKSKPTVGKGKPTLHVVGSQPSEKNGKG